MSVNVTENILFLLLRTFLPTEAFDSWGTIRKYVCLYLTAACGLASILTIHLVDPDQSYRLSIENRPSEKKKESLSPTRAQAV